MDKLSQLIYQMREGKIPTSQLFECPFCGEIISITASESWRHSNLINISLRCRSCPACEMCGVEKWDCWEKLKLENIDKETLESLKTHYGIKPNES